MTLPKKNNKDKESGQKVLGNENLMNRAIAKEVQRLSANSEFPIQLLNQLKECTDGFVLFFIDGEGGLQSVADLESDVNAVALVSHILRWGMTMNNMQNDIFRANFKGNEENDDFEDEKKSA
jgi:hypothetical protein